MKPPSRSPQPQWLPPPPEPPPVNRAQGCFAVLLWLMPTVFVPICIGAAATTNSSIGIIFGGMVCVAFIIGTGWFNASMSKAVLTARPEERNRRIWGGVAVFFLAQLFIVPTALCGIVYAICAAYPMHL